MQGSNPDLYGKNFSKRVYVCICKTNSICCIVATNTNFKSNYTPVKIKNKTRKTKAKCCINGIIRYIASWLWLFPLGKMYVTHPYHCVNWSLIPLHEWVKATQSCLTLRLRGLYSPWNSPGQNTGVGSLSLLQGIFLTQGLNPGFLNCRQILYQLSHQGRPRILEWVAYPFSSGSSQPRNQTRVSCIAGGFFTIWVNREAQ